MKKIILTILFTLTVLFSVIGQPEIIYHSNKAEEEKSKIIAKEWLNNNAINYNIPSHLRHGKLSYDCYDAKKIAHCSLSNQPLSDTTKLDIYFYAINFKNKKTRSKQIIIFILYFNLAGQFLNGLVVIDDKNVINDNDSNTRKAYPLDRKEYDVN
jgi:hypothetical protein